MRALRKVSRKLSKGFKSFLKEVAAVAQDSINNVR